MQIFSSQLKISSHGHTDIIDLTPEIKKIVTKSKIVQGTATIFVIGSTAGITTIEYEPGLVKDLQAAFQRMAPDHIAYAHHERWGDDNGHSHIRASILGPSLTVPLSEGQIILGAWQQIILVDFDTRSRQRDLVVQVIGK